jgi:MSHA biogenesis protein MshO
MIATVKGMTLIELVVVIALIAIVSAVAAVAVREPMQAYVDTSRRAELSDVADSALRRIGREVRLALPNSVRVTTVGATKYVEFLQVRTGGRYRAQADAGNPAADWLDLTATGGLGDNQFNIIGAPSTLTDQVIAPNSDILVVRNESATAARSNAYAFNQSGAGFDCTTGTGRNCNTSRVTGGPTATTIAGEYLLQFQRRLFNCENCPGTLQGLGSPGNRFYVIRQSPVTYVCAANAALDANGDAAGTLTRVSGYAIAFTQPTAFGGGTSSLVAKNVSACEIDYDANALGNNGLVAMRLQLTRGNEAVSLYHEVHVNNAP